jgi:UDP:flavonoid glycosyltransferase YjiC (YdhE family)
MSRILFATVPVSGHVAPLVPLARALVQRGHEVGWYTGAKFRAKVEAAGARFFPFRAARDFDDLHLDDAYPERRNLSGLAQLRFDMKHVFIDAGPLQLQDLEAVVKEFPAHVVVGDTAMMGALFLQERGGPRVLYVGVIPLIRTSPDTAPFGLGLQPMPGALGRLRNRALHGLVQKVLFRDVQAHWDRMRERTGLPPTGWWMTAIERAAGYLHTSVPGFEYPQSDLPAHFRFVGMMPPDRPEGVPEPDFWGETGGTRPVVHVTQGTIANLAPDLIRPAVQGLASEDLLTVVSTGNRPVESLGLGPLPANARVATFLSYPDLLPRTSVMVTNGGYGGVQLALSYGVPLVVAGRSEDKPEVAARVAWSGAGIDLRTDRPRPEAVRKAVRAILDDPRYRARAQALAREYSGYDAVKLATGIIEEEAGRS